MKNDAASTLGVVAALCATFLVPVASHAQTLETETARLLPRRALELGAAVEVQGGGGTERAVPLIVLYGITDHLEISVEPVPYTAIIPEGGASARGVGDLEGTLTWRIRDETLGAPALAFAGEVKVPTAKNQLIGTGRADYTGWAIASKRFGRLDTHANVAYTLSGSPRGIKLNNVWTGALAAVFAPGANFELLAETMATSAAAAESGDAPVTPVPGRVTVIPPEAAGAELIGTLGAGRYLVPGFLVFGSVSYDNTQATLLRVGMTLRIR